MQKRTKTFITFADLKPHTFKMPLRENAIEEKSHKHILRLNIAVKSKPGLK